MGRFLSPDPVGFADGGVGYFNRYAYTFNDPVNHTDPSGMCGTASRAGGGGSSTCSDNITQFDRAAAAKKATKPRPAPTAPNASPPEPANDNKPQRGGGRLKRPNNSAKGALRGGVRRAAPFLGALIFPPSTAGPEGSERGQLVYRVSGYPASRMGNPMASYWGLADPRTMTEWDWRNSHAVAPEWNSADYFVAGWVSDLGVAGIEVVKHQTINGVFYSGGALEVILVDPNITVRVLDEGPLKFLD